MRILGYGGTTTPSRPGSVSTDRVFRDPHKGSTFRESNMAIEHPPSFDDVQ